MGMTLELDIDRVKIKLAELELTGIELARRSGYSEKTISFVLNRGTASPKVAGAIARGLGLRVEDITLLKGAIA